MSLGSMSVAQWAEAVSMEAYGLIGLKPAEFWALTVPEFQDLLEAARWREARTQKLLMTAVLQLLAPYAKEGFNVQWELEGMFRGDPEQRELALREQRLALMARPDGDECR